MGLPVVTLAERAIACEGWRWMLGMRIVWPTTFRAGILTFSEVIGWRIHYATGGTSGGDWNEFPPGALPDLSDPATLGCLLALVRSAYGDPRAVICWQGGAQCGYWETFVADSEITADTEAEALVTALECAP